MKEVFMAMIFFCTDSERVVLGCSVLYKNFKCLPEAVKLLFMSSAILARGILNICNCQAIVLLFRHHPTLHIEL